MTPCVSVGQKWERSLHVNSRRTSVLFPCGWLVFSDHWWGGDISGGTGKSGKEQQLIGVWWRGMTHWGVRGGRGGIHGESQGRSAPLTKGYTHHMNGTGGCNSTKKCDGDSFSCNIEGIPTNSVCNKCIISSLYWTSQTSEVH